MLTVVQWISALQTSFSGDDMNAAFIIPFVDAAKEVFNKMVRVPLTLGKPHLKNGEQPQFAVSATIGISGTVTGIVVLGFPQQVALDVAAALAGCPMTTIDQDCVDALGEVANMIAGSAKSRFPGGANSLSLPNVTLGSHRFSFPTGVPIILIPCDTPGGRFQIAVGFRGDQPGAADAS